MTKDKHWMLNADVGEGCDDSLIMPFIECANVACAAHAGDAATVYNTLTLAKHHNVTVGAHPGYPDKDNFGRFSLNMSATDLAATLTEQLSFITSMAREQGLSIQYVKPHGALNHDMLQKTDVFDTICNVVAELDSNLAIMIPTNAKEHEQRDIANKYGLSIWWEVFADRAYEPNGLLRSRQYDDAVHAEPKLILEQLQNICENSHIIAIDGSILDVGHACTVCIHGDNSPSVTAIEQWSSYVLSEYDE